MRWEGAESRPAAVVRQEAQSMTRVTRLVFVVACVVGISGAVVAPAAGQNPWRLQSPDGKSWVQFGLLAQAQGEWISTADAKDTAQNLFLRRLRLVFGGKVNDKITFFVETDSPNLGKGLATGRKDEPLFLQDVILTYTFRDEFQIDTGMLLTPLSHNGGQGATTLLNIDYGPYSFLYSDPTTSKVGRDYGVQARGYVFKKHFEYRLGAFQGVRGTAATTPLRVVARAVWYPFEAETGFFYTGTNLGARRILAIGASYDRQDDYQTIGADLYWDWKLKGGNGVTAQADVVRFDGGTTLSTLLRQNVWLVEAGFYHGASKFGPFVQAAGRDFSATSSIDEQKVVGGVAWWGSGHRFNVKVGLARLTRDVGPARTQFIVQGQVYMY